jgi:hypothetical protein
MADRIRVIYIAGYTRSGSTLLSRILAKLEGAVFTGEIYTLFHYWDNGEIEQRVCECGELYNKCVFWSKVFSNIDADTRQALHLRMQIARERNIPRLINPRLQSKEFNALLSQYREALLRFCQNVLSVGNGNLILDASKHIAFAFVLADVVDLDVIHLVRDSRAVAYSWRKKVKEPAVVDKEAYMPVYPPYKVGATWSYENSAAHLLSKVSRRYIFCKYEDFVANPQLTIKSLLTQLDMNCEIAFSKENAVWLDRGHTMGGNPSRFKYGNIEIKPDLDWHSKMSLRDYGIVTFLTWPLLLKYGYVTSISKITSSFLAEIGN